MFCCFSSLSHHVGNFCKHLSILAWSHTSTEIDHAIISTAILLPSADLRRVVVSYKQKYVHEVLVNPFVKLAQEKKWIGEMTVQT